MASKRKADGERQRTLTQSTLPFKRFKIDQEKQKPDISESVNKDQGTVDAKSRELLNNFNSSPKPKPDNLSPSVEEKRIAAKMKLMFKKTLGVVDHIGPSWFKALEPEFSKPYFEELCKFLDVERKGHIVYPPPDKVFTWTQITPIEKISAVIVGQDPYHGPNQAHGLCFSVPKGVGIPPSLENMYKELATSMGDFKHPGHGNLVGWAEQGVLLLNSVLTVRQRTANSHKDRGWEKFTTAVLSWLNENAKGIVFILWGSYAQKKGEIIDKKRHHVLKGIHPSPLSAHRGFFGCDHFKLCNDLLGKEGRKEIDWKHLP